MWTGFVIAFFGAFLGGIVGGMVCMIMALRDVESRQEELCHNVNKLRKRMKRTCMLRKES